MPKIECHKCGRGLGSGAESLERVSAGWECRPECGSLASVTLTPDEQLRRWVEGDPQCPNTHGECCPDFSCCRPALLAPEPARRAFASATTPEGRERWLGAFLSGAIENITKDSGARVHLAGTGEDPS